MLCQETSWNSLGCVGTDVNKPADNGVGDDDEDDVFPEVEVDNSLVDIDWSQDVEEGCQESWNYKFIMFHRVITSHKLFFSVDAVLVTFTTWIAERSSSQIDVTVGISSHQMEERTEARTFCPADNTCLVAACVRVACEQLSEQSGNLEESIHEGTSNYTAPVSCQESCKRSWAFIVFSVPIPVSGATSYTEID